MSVASQAGFCCSAVPFKADEVLGSDEFTFELEQPMPLSDLLAKLDARYPDSNYPQYENKLKEAGFHYAHKLESTGP